MSKKFLIFVIFCITSCNDGISTVTTNNTGSLINPVINSFSSNQYNPAPNESFQISWSANALSCSASGDWTGEKDISGNENLSFSSNGTYISFKLLRSRGHNNSSK